MCVCVFFCVVVCVWFCDVFEGGGMSPVLSPGILPSLYVLCACMCDLMFYVWWTIFGARCVCVCMFLVVASRKRRLKRWEERPDVFVSRIESIVLCAYVIHNQANKQRYHNIYGQDQQKQRGGKTKKTKQKGLVKNVNGGVLAFFCFPPPCFKGSSLIWVSMHTCNFLVNCVCV